MASSHHEHRNIILAAFSCLALSVVLGLLSDGVHHDDDLTHFLMARWSAWYPGYLLHVWGRPGITLPLAAVSWMEDPNIAWHAARMLSAIVTAATAVIAARVALVLGVRRAWLIVLACFAQPLAMVLSFTTLSETFAAFYLTAAVALVRRRPIAASMVGSLMLLSRHEAMALVPLWWIVLLFGTGPRRGRLIGMIGILWAPIVHNLLHRWTYGTWPLSLFLEPSGSREYPAEGWLSYLPHALYAISPAIAGLAVVGGLTLCRRRRFLVPALAGGYLLIHVSIKALGFYGSGGYGRFMVSVAPMIAILAVVGLERLLLKPSSAERNGGRGVWLMHALVWGVAWLAYEVELSVGRLNPLDPVWIRAVPAIVILALVAAAIFHRRGIGLTIGRGALCLLALTWLGQWLVIVRPLRLGPKQALVKETVVWMKAQGYGDAPFFSANPWFACFLDLVENPRARKDSVLLASMPVGTVFVWDSIYAENQFHGLASSADYEADAHYVLLRMFTQRDETDFKLLVFKKVRETPLPIHPKPSYPRSLTSDAEPVRGIYYRRVGRTGVRNLHESR